MTRLPSTKGNVRRRRIEPVAERTRGDVESGPNVRSGTWRCATLAATGVNGVTAYRTPTAITGSVSGSNTNPTKHAFPDLVTRLRAGAGLNAPIMATFYTAGAEGYTNYPLLAA